MNQRVHNLSKWRYVGEGEAIHFPGRAQRTVIVDVNCPEEVRFYVRQDEGDVQADPEKAVDEAAGRLKAGQAVETRETGSSTLGFIAVVKGRDRLEFAVDGSFDLIAEGGEAYVYSIDGMDIVTRVIEPEIFTRLANRRQRNPHLEMMQYQMRVNQERFEASIREEAERRVKALEERLEKYVPQRDIRAPAERVGGSPERDAGADGQSEAAAGSEQPPEDEGGFGEAPAGKRKKAKASSDV